MKWRPAKSIEVLKRQLNAAYPKRSRVSDGIVGDIAHQKAGTSDHLPNSANVVTAMDITHSETRGINCHELAKQLQSSGDKRIKYLIFNGQITTKGDIRKWKPYTGANAHRSHLHISVASARELYDSSVAWNLGGKTPDAELYYTVVKGDTVSRIIKRFGLSMQEFFQLNGFTNDNFDADNIQTGNRFRIRLR